MLYEVITIDKINELINYSQHSHAIPASETINNVFNKMRININLPEKESINIPQSGPRNNFV